MTRAVVFAYHDVGARCLAGLIAHGVDVPLVVTHADDPGEAIWFASVAELARSHGIPAIAPADPNAPDITERVRSLRPDFLFSFYYRLMLGPVLLAAAGRGAYNMHGSLLPKYRGRAPVNWAILHGEAETGATLHEMTGQPDAGRIVDQQAVPILPNDIALDVFRKVTAAAGQVLDRALPSLIAGTANPRPQDLAAGSYYGRRRPEDGRIDWAKSAASVHNLIRAVARPYPGAFCSVAGRTLRLLRTFNGGERSPVAGQPALMARGGELYLRCADGGMLKVLQAEYDGGSLGADTMRARFGTETLALDDETAKA